MTGWGQEGPLALGRRSRYQLHLGDRRTGRDRHQGETGPAAQSGRRFRRRRALSGGRRARRAARSEGNPATGQVVDAAMCDGAASLMSMFFDMAAAGRWTDQRETNFLDGGAHFYGVYECSCGSFISIGSIEPQFYALLRRSRRPVRKPDFDAHLDRRRLAGTERETGRGFQDQEPRRMVHHHGRHRHLLRADPDHAGSSKASAHGSARNIRRRATA